jgi:predicted nucleic acid-binding protein
MKRVLFDVNIILDVLLDRKPHAYASAAAWATAERGISEGFLAAHALTTIYYLVQKELGGIKAKRTVSALLRVFGVAGVDGAVIEEALRLSSPDFEDAVTAAAARFANCDYIVTRDAKGFRRSPVQALTPEAITPLLSNKIT